MKELDDVQVQLIEELVKVPLETTKSYSIEVSGTEPQVEINPNITIPLVTLTEILLNHELNKQNMDTNITLTENQISILNFVVKNSPSALDDVSCSILEIIKDSKIDLSDIPSFIKIVKVVYILCYQNKEINVTGSQLVSIIGPVIKYIVQIIIKYNNVSNSDVLIASCDSIIDISIEMIELQSSLKTKKCSFRIC